MVMITHTRVYSAERTVVSEGSPMEDPYGSKSQTASKTQSLCGERP
jgi:hypothetical protein